MIVVVEEVERLDVDVPVIAGRIRIDPHQRVGVVVVAWAAGAGRELFVTRERSRIRDADVNVAFFVERRRVPEATTRVHPGVAPQVVGGGIEIPFNDTGFSIECVDNPAHAALVEAIDRTRDRADIDHAAVDARSNGDALAARAEYGRAPQLVSGRKVKRENDARATERREQAAVTDADPVGAAARHCLVVFLVPNLLAGGLVERVDVAHRVLHVNNIAHHGRVAGEVAVGAFCGDRHGPCFGERRHIAAVDRAPLHIARVAHVEVFNRPVGFNLELRRNHRQRGCGRCFGRCILCGSTGRVGHHHAGRCHGGGSRDNRSSIALRKNSVLFHAASFGLAIMSSCTSGLLRPTASTSPKC